MNQSFKKGLTQTTLLKRINVNILINLFLKGCKEGLTQSFDCKAYGVEI